MTTPPLDRLDRAILAGLQTDAHESHEAIGARIGLSASAVLRRIKKLEEAGVIERYVALLNARAVGLELTAYVNVRLEKRAEHAKRNPMDEFRASVQTWPEVVDCVALTGEMDLVLRLLVCDMSAYSRFMMDVLLRHPSVQDCKSSFVIDHVKTTTALPV